MDLHVGVSGVAVRGVEYLRLVGLMLDCAMFVCMILGSVCGAGLSDVGSSILVCLLLVCLI